MLHRFFKKRWQRLCAALGVIVAAFVLAFSAGGVIFTATVLTMSTYLGTMITMSRLPKDPNPDWGLFKKATFTPLIKLRNFMFDNPLLMTISMAAMTGAIVGFTTVTGIVTIAISALLGDVLVQAYKDGLDIVQGVEEKNLGRETAGSRTGLVQTSDQTHPAMA